MSGSRPACPCGCVPTNECGLCAACEDDDALDEVSPLDVDAGPFDANEHGIWCVACGEHIAAPWNLGSGWVAPDSCKTCGFPDFEDGAAYFTGSD